MNNSDNSHKIELSYDEYLQIVKLSHAIGSFNRNVTGTMYTCRFEYPFTYISFNDNDEPYIDARDQKAVEMVLDLLAFGMDAYYWLLPYPEREETKTPFWDFYQKVGNYIDYEDNVAS